MDMDLDWRVRGVEFTDYENHGETLEVFSQRLVFHSGFPNHCLDEEHHPFAQSASDIFVTPTSSRLFHRFCYYTRLVLSWPVSPLNLTQLVVYP
jgi:hypothetical protein